jgi:hypothetical protein
MLKMTGFGYDFKAQLTDEGLPTAITTILQATEQRIFQFLPWW